MTSSFELLCLPRELRDYIYSFLFTAPNGRFEMGKTCYRALIEDGGEDIHLSILRTCKQIYTETKDLLWQYNTLYLESSLDIHAPAREGILATSITTRFRHKVQKVQIYFDILFDKTFDRRLIFGHNLRTLAAWVIEGRLSSVTLELRSILGRSQLTQRQMDNMLRGRAQPIGGIIYSEYLDELRLGTTRSNPLSTIKRQIIVNASVKAPILDFHGPGWAPRETASPGNFMAMLEELADTWGGQLELNQFMAESSSGKESSGMTGTYHYIPPRSL